MAVKHNGSEIRWDLVALPRMCQTFSVMFRPVLIAMFVFGGSACMKAVPVASGGELTDTADAAASDGASEEMVEYVDTGIDAIRTEITEPVYDVPVSELDADTYGLNDASGNGSETNELADVVEPNSDGGENDVSDTLGQVETCPWSSASDPKTATFKVVLYDVWGQPIEDASVIVWSPSNAPLAEGNHALEPVALCGPVVLNVTAAAPHFFAHQGVVSYDGMGEEASLASSDR